MPQLRNSRRGSARAAQYSHWLVSSPPRREWCSGDPSVIESPTAATTNVSSAPRIRLLGDLRRFALVLSHDVIPTTALEDVLHIRLLVAGEHGEVRRVAPELLVLVAAHADPFDARWVATLADEVQRLTLEPEMVGEVVDPLVDLTKDSFVEADTFVPVHDR